MESHYALSRIDQRGWLTASRCVTQEHRHTLLAFCNLQGCTLSPLRVRVKRAEVEEGRLQGTTSADAQRIAELEREVRELGGERDPDQHRTVAILAHSGKEIPMAKATTPFTGHPRAPHGQTSAAPQWPSSAGRPGSRARWRPWCSPRRTAVRTHDRAGRRPTPRRV